MLSLVNLVDQVDMAILRGVLPILEEEWGLSDLQLGMLGFAFVVVNAVATIPAGWVADRVRRTRLMGWTLLSWSALILLSATAVNYWNLLAARAVMGIGQSIDDPAGTSLLADYYPPRMRARVFSFQQIAVFVGSGIGLALGGWVGSALGWRWAFALVGMPGSLVAFLVFRMREPRRGESDVPEGSELPTEHDAEPVPFRQLYSEMKRDLAQELKSILRIRTMRYILVGVSALLFTVSGIGYWLTVYHQRYSGMSVAQAAAFTAVVFGVGGGAGTLFGGWFADRLFSRGPGARIAYTVWSAIGCAVCFMISFAVPSLSTRIGLQFIGILLAAGSVPALRASMLDVVPAESRGVGTSAFALVSTACGTALAPPLVGLLSDLTGSLVTAFYIVFPPVIVGLLFLLRARTTIVQDVEVMIQMMAQRAADPDGDASAAEQAQPSTGTDLTGVRTPPEGRLDDESVSTGGSSAPTGRPDHPR